MNDDMVRRVKANLREQFYIMDDTWLRGCIEYCISQEPNASDSNVAKFVASQWILSDLRDIMDNVGCLPPNVASQNKIVLPRKYILQMVKMYDISTSKYSQLEKMRKVDRENVQATAIKAESWEPKGKRMIQLFLTDGVQDITAIEYRTIRTLKDTMLPGFKLLIIGPVTCRKGVILLEEKHYKEIGGEVDSMLVPNAVENVLARAVNMEENPNPYADDKEQNEGGLGEFLDDNFEINQEELSQIEQLSLENNERSRTNTIREFSNNERNVPGATNTSERARSNDSKKGKTNNKSQNIGNEIASYFQTTSDDAFGDNFDDILGAIDIDNFENIDTSRPNVNSDSNHNSRRQRTISSALPTNHAIDTTSNKPTVTASKTKINQNSSKIQLKALTTQPANSSILDDRNVIIVEDYDSETSFLNGSVNTPAPICITIESDDFEDLDFEADDFADKFPQNKTSSTEMEPSSEPITTSSKIKPNNAGVFHKSEEFQAKARKKQSPQTSRVATGSHTHRNSSVVPGKRTAEDTTSPNPCSRKVLRIDKPPKYTANRKITEFTKKLNPKEETPPEICDFICDVLQKRSSESITYATIRGKMSKFKTLTAKDSQWYLEATVMDDTASIDVVFSSLILEDLIGFSVAEFQEKKKLRKTNPEVNDFLRKSLRTAEAKLRRLDALVDLELSPTNLSLVVKITQLTEEQRTLIDRRMKSFRV